MNTETYYESAEGVVISRERALQEVRSHGCDQREFLAELGERTEYEAQMVLDWLGY